MVEREAFVITSKACQLDKSYRVLYAPVKTLSKYYRRSRFQTLFFRYGSLKKMIKDCIYTYRNSKKFQKAMKSEATDIDREEIEDSMYEPLHEKTNDLGFRSGPTQTRLQSHRK